MWDCSPVWASARTLRLSGFADGTAPVIPLESGTLKLADSTDRKPNVRQLDLIGRFAHGAQPRDLFKLVVGQGAYAIRPARIAGGRRRQCASYFTKPRSPERFDIPEGTLDHSVG
jgi:hypothetical protein